MPQASVLPSLATGALTGIGATASSKVVEKAIGNGVVYMKKNGMGVKITPAGKGLYLAPWSKGSSVGDGKYLKSGNGHTDGSGLLLGPNSPFKHVPILGMIL